MRVQSGCESSGILSISGFETLYEEVIRVFETSKDPDKVIASAPYNILIRFVGGLGWRSGSMSSLLGRCEVVGVGSVFSWG